MESTSPSREPHILWRFFSSVRLTLFLLILLATASIVGTVIPQREGMVEFARRLSPGMLEVFGALQLFDVYHSLWFRTLITALALNLIVCSLNRLSPTLRRLRAVPRADRIKPFEEIPDHRRFSVRLPVEAAAADAEALLQRRTVRRTRKESKEGVFLYGERGRFSVFGVYIVHMSVLLILLGSILGSISGFEAYVNLPEGEGTDVVRLRGSGDELKLGFRVECKDFFVAFYENGTPKEFRSTLRFFDGDKTEEADVRVNHPFAFRGIRFYQAGWGSLPGDKATLILRRGAALKEDTTIHAVMGEPVDLPGGEGRFYLDDIRGDFMRMGMGPAARIVVHPKEGEPVPFWIFLHPDHVEARFSESLRHFPKLNPSAFEPYTFFLKEIDERYYTGLQVNKDPGVPFVWLGFFMIIIGLFVTFFMSHRRIWVRIEKDGDQTVVSLAGKGEQEPRRSRARAGPPDRRPSGPLGRRGTGIMINTVILSYITFVYFAAFMGYLFMMVMGKELFGRIATVATPPWARRALRGPHSEMGGILPARHRPRPHVQPLRITHFYSLGPSHFSTCSSSGAPETEASGSSQPLWPSLPCPMPPTHRTSPNASSPWCRPSRATG